MGGQGGKGVRGDSPRTTPEPTPSPSSTLETTPSPVTNQSTTTPSPSTNQSTTTRQKSTFGPTFAPTPAPPPTRPTCGQWVRADGSFEVVIGASSRDLRLGAALQVTPQRAFCIGPCSDGLASQPAQRDPSST